MGTGKVLGHQIVGLSALHLLPITTAVTEHSGSGQDDLSILFMLLHLITILLFFLMAIGQTSNPVQWRESLP